MFKTPEEKRADKAKKFMTGTKAEFEKISPRDTITEIKVTTCVEEDGAFAITGAVAATSPTGKSKTYGYIATVTEDADGACTLAKLLLREE